MQGVRRVRAPQSASEMEALVALNEPVILEGLVFPNAAENLGSARLPVRYMQDQQKPFAFATQELSFSELCATLQQEAEQESCGRHYLAGPDLLLHQDAHVASWARLQKEAVPVAPERVQEVGLWCGRDGQHSQMHFDVAHNLLHVVAGRKSVVLGNPRDYRKMYTYTSADLDLGDCALRRMYRFSRCNVRQPDYEQFPLLQQCQLQLAELNAGDTLLIPLAFFHDVLSEGSANSVLSIAINVFWKATDEECKRHKWLRVFLDE
jgi:hypothetical protein